RRSRVSSYQVRLAGVPVATLVENIRGLLGVRPDAGYRGMSPRPILGQQFEDDLTRTRWGGRSGQLPAFLANLLPESGGPLRAVIVRSLGLENPSDPELLSALGLDLPGAVEFVRVEDQVEIEPGPEPHLEPQLETARSQALRFSLAGVQLKFSMVQEGDRLTFPASGLGGEWIVKIESTAYPGLVENEFAMLEWARAIGLNVPELMVVGPESLESLRGLVSERPRGLAVRRYDRVGANKIHQEDFAQVFGWMPERKYDAKADALLRVTAAILGPSGYEEQLRRLVFAIAIGNHDAHLKNWSLIYPDGWSPALSPVYDQVATVSWPFVDREMALKLGSTREPAQVDGALLRRVASQLGQDPARAEHIAIATVEAMRAAWPAARDHLPFDHQEAVIQHWNRVPLARAAGTLET
ncbi:MAG: HipA domain-containing protein, partial [Candidatus Eremiobacterota bacterium]